MVKSINIGMVNMEDENNSNWNMDDLVKREGDWWYYQVDVAKLAKGLFAYWFVQVGFAT